ncbi:MAG: hypothetical protein IID39_08240 [Planctomycetes bacterium]|nr:hypothetical protein [Planctomycetota bacterium]
MPPFAFHFASTCISSGAATSSAPALSGTLPPEIESKVRAVDGVTEATVEVVWDPPWTPERMSEAAKLQLNML